MYKLVLVDDDAILRNGLKTVVDWHSLGIQFAGEAEDGEEGLRIIEEINPELVITDINMPNMNGLELITKITSRFRSCKVIVLSGFDEFDYVRKALRERVFDYLLKPIGEEALAEVLRKAIKSLEEEKQRFLNEEELNRKLKQSIPALKERYLNYVLNGRMKLEEAIELCKTMPFAIRCKNVIVAVVEVSQSSYEQDYGKLHIIMIGLKDMIKEVLKEQYIFEIAESHIGRLAVILNYTEAQGQTEIIEDMMRWCRQFNDMLEQYFPVDVTIGIGRPYENGEMAVFSYREAVESLEYRILMKGTKILFYGDIYIDTSQYMYYPLDIEERILTAVRGGNVEKAAYETAAFISCFINKNITSPFQLKRGCQQLIYSLMRKLVEWNINLELTETRGESIEQRIRRAMSSAELETQVIGFIKYAAMSISEMRSGANRSVIEKACSYMEKHYGENIGLDDIAGAVFLTPNYFAGMFKNEMGKTVLTYLTDLRMEKARQLLRDRAVKIYAVSEKVGYRDVKYFVKTFKKYFGMTPAEFRQIELNDNRRQ